MESVRTAALLLLSLLAVAGVGGVFALWSETLTVDITVETGELDAMLSVLGSGDDEIDQAAAMGEPDPTVKDVSSIQCNVVDQYTIEVTITNAYPSITYWCEISLTNTGTIPFKIQDIQFSGNLLDVASVFGFFDDNMGTTDPSAFFVGSQLEQGQSDSDYLVIHLSNAANEGATYSATITILVVQWNEFVPPGG